MQPRASDSAIGKQRDGVTCTGTAVTEQFAYIADEFRREVRAMINTRADASHDLTIFSTKGRGGSE